MRPINLKIKGINSYVSEQSIDFDKLAESNIFGIFGETGSGKTTILDSIILALYGVSDRDNLQNIVNVNTKDAYVEFTFEMEDNAGKLKKYFVRRDFKVRPSGLKTEAILNDIKKNLTIAEMPDNVNNKILEIIGIGKKEFTKCVALPQGEFDRFLADTPALRKKTLAKLFDLEQFGVILNERLKLKKNQVILNKQSFEDKIALYQGINQETIDKTEEILKNSSTKLNTLTRQISKDKKLLEKIKIELEEKEKLLEMEVNLSIKQSELADINFIEKQIEYTEKYGDFTILNSRYNACVEELNEMTTLIENNKQSFGEFNKNIDRLNILIEDNKQKIINIQDELINIQNAQEKKALHEEKLTTLQAEKAKISEKIMNMSSKVVETTANLKNNKELIIELENTYKRLESAIFDNMDIIDKLSNCQTFKTRQDFALFLSITKNKINPDSLAEVENFNIFDEVTTVIHDLENYELGVRKEIGEILKDLSHLDIDYEDLDEIKDSFIKKNEVLNKRCDEIEDRIIAIKESLAGERSLIDTYQAQVEDYNDQLEKVKKLIDIELDGIRNIPPISDVDYLVKTLEKYKEESISLDNELNETHTQLQKTIIDTEVATNNIENYKDRIAQLQIALKPYNKNTFKQKADSSLLLEHDELPVLKEKVNYFHKELNALEITTLAQREKTKDFIYTRDDYNNLLVSISTNEEKLTDLKVFINVNQITMDIQKQNLATVLELQKELDAINRQFTAIEKLESLLVGGALIDFVAEEYMGLITEFANSFVYKISKGKYLLNYDGDFNVIDNFNGGIKRSVKTLSGGERFIVSLSLALGISQSIAVNNNKNFNFFFIDEGFGNLSENYIEKVIQSFDVLIKLNFTVGFITHVEKMQYYLNNRIIVTKQSVEDGSKIEEIF